MEDRDAPDGDSLEWLVSRFHERQASDQDDLGPRTVVVLGAAPGVPGWPGIVRAIADVLAVPVPAGQDPIDAVRQHLARLGPAAAPHFWRACTAVFPVRPTLGHQHLANLAAAGCVDLVLTTSWDPLTEIAFSQLMPPPQYRVVNPGTVGDLEAAAAVRERGLPQLVMLNGDLRTHLLPRTAPPPTALTGYPGLLAALAEVLTRAVVIVSGSPQEDRALATVLTQAQTAELLYRVGQSPAGPNSRWFAEHALVTDQAATDFDVFMTDLDRQVELAGRRHRSLADGLVLDERAVTGFQRPWGSGEVFATSENCSVRILSVEAGQRLSFQRHLCRDELFVAIDEAHIDLCGEDLAEGVRGDCDPRIGSVSLTEGDYLLVSRGMWHRIRGTRRRARVLEVAFGVYDENFDIERLLDSYGRADRVGYGLAFPPGGRA
jgi:mannose-1-phosphate guanylyltransferase/mannose-6-phosphate isomerase